MSDSNNQEINKLVQSISGLVTLPDVYMRISQLVDDPNSTLYDIADAISRDPAFTALLLKVANSSFYGFSSTIDTAIKAVSVIGTSQIRSLALSLSVARSFSGLSNALVSMENFWRHSLYCALFARHLARLVRRCDAEALFTAGMLHDIGELIVFCQIPDKARASLNLVLDEGAGLPVYQAERKIIGFDHAQVGGALADLWQLPPLLRECLCYHHDIAASTEKYRREVALVHIANEMALLAELRLDCFADIDPLDPLAWEVTGLDEEQVLPLLEEVQLEIIEAEQLFFSF